MIEPQPKYVWTVEAQPREDLFEIDMKAAKDKKTRQQTPSKDLLEYLKASNSNRRANTTDAELSERFSRIQLPPAPADQANTNQIAGLPSASTALKPAEQALDIDQGNREQSLGPEGAGKTQKSLKSLDLSKLSGPEGIPKRDPNYKPPSRDVSPIAQSPPKQPAPVQPNPALPQGGATPLKPSAQPQPQLQLPPQPNLQPRQSATLLPSVTPSAQTQTQPVTAISKPTLPTPVANVSQSNKPPGSAKLSAAELRKQQLEADIRRMKVMEELSKKRAASQDTARSPSPGSLQRREEQARQRQASLKAQVKKYKEQKEREEQLLAERQRQRLQDEEERRKARSKVAMALRRDSLEKRLQAEKEAAVKRSVELKERAQKEAEKALRTKKAIESEFGSEREKMLREQRANDKITSIFNSQPIKDELKSHEPQLKYIFKHYVDLIRDPSAVNSKLQDQSDILHLRNFMAFMNQFGIVPVVLNLQEAKLIYRSATRRKTLDKDAPVGLDYKAFSEILLRISIKKANLFSSASDQLPKSNATDSDQNGSIVDEMLDFSTVKQQEDAYDELDQFKRENLAMLFQFLDLPKEKPQLADKLNSLRLGNFKTAEQRARILEVKRKFGIDRRRAPSATQRDPSKSKLLQGESILSETQQSPPPKPAKSEQPPKEQKLPENPPEISNESKDKDPELSEQSAKKKDKPKKQSKKDNDEPSKDSKGKLKKKASGVSNSQAEEKDSET